MEKILKLLENQLVITIITLLITAAVNGIANYLNKSIINYNQKKDKARYKKVRYIRGNSKNKVWRGWKQKYR